MRFLVTVTNRRRVLMCRILISVRQILPLRGKLKSVLLNLAAAQDVSFPALTICPRHLVRGSDHPLNGHEIGIRKRTRSPVAARLD
jgi:hypothetical protein